MVHSTKGIVLRTVAYGETSVIASVFTEMFGLQSYLVNGVRTNKKQSSKQNLYQPSSIIEMEVYHNEFKNLQRIKDAKWHYLYRQIMFNVYSNTIALFMIEVLQKTIRQPEQNIDLYNFIEDSFIELDNASGRVQLNYPLYFLIHLAGLLGFTIQDNHSPQHPLLDLKDGNFVASSPDHHFVLDLVQSASISELMKVMRPAELDHIQINNPMRRQLTEALLQFYALHVPDFGHLKSLTILQEVVS